MHAWEQIQKTLDYIEENLDGELSPERLAAVACLSPFYYQRLFSRLVKKPVAEYVRLRRMARAAEALRDGDQRILDVALSLGFSSHGHFTRTFKDTFGMTPDEYRGDPRPLNRMTKPELLLHYTLVDEGVPLVTDGIVLEISRRRLDAPVPCLGLERRMPASFVEGLGTQSGEDPLDGLWRDFHTRKAAIPGLTEDSPEIGVTHPCGRADQFCYFAGGEAGAGAGAGAGYAAWTLPQGAYIVCSFEAECFEALVMDALYKAQQYLYGAWLPGHGVQTEPFCAERYAAHSPETSRMELWLKCVDK